MENIMFTYPNRPKSKFDIYSLVKYRDEIYSIIYYNYNQYAHTYNYCLNQLNEPDIEITVLENSLSLVTAPKLNINGQYIFMGKPTGKPYALLEGDVVSILEQLKPPYRDFFYRVRCLRNQQIYIISAFEVEAIDL